VKKRRGSLTVEEYFKRLEADPEYPARVKAREEAQARAAAEFHADERELVEEINRLGLPFKINCVQEFVYTTRDYSPALPILTEHLGKPHIPRVVTVIARSLMVPQAKGSVSIVTRLIEVFRRTSMRPGGEQVCKEAVGYAISRLASPVFEDAIRELLLDKSHGDGRACLLLSNVIIRSRRPDTCDLLTGLLEDTPSMVCFTLDALAKRRCVQAAEAVRRLVDSPDRDVAKRAARALKKLT